ncbi:MAG TPA: hypothetical protein DCS43_04590 [Verrucomicrobia bacterium]|nr:hypothetical protein [Verrucomicrobiota bacterium]
MYDVVVIAGIGRQLVSRAVEEAGDTLPDFSNDKRAHKLLRTRVNIFRYADLCDQAAGAMAALRK